MNRRFDARGRVLADVALGAVAGLGLAPWGAWFLTLPALAMLFYRIGPRPVSGLFRAGLGYFALALFWITDPFFVDARATGWMAPFALAAMAAGGAGFWAFSGWIARRCGGGVWAVALALVLVEWVRGWVFTGFPWAMLGHIWIDTPVAQLASLGGALLLSLLTTFAAAGLAKGGKAGVAVVVMLALVWTGGVWRLSLPDPDTDQRPVLRLVQPDAVQSLKWQPDWAKEFYRRLIAESAAPGRRDLVIWPETAVSFLLNDAGPALSQMAEAADAPLLLGIQREDSGRFYNSLVEITPKGELGQIYDKFHLVPFGEYVPLQGFGWSGFAAQNGFGYSAGRGAQDLLIDGLPLMQPLICYEAIFPRHVLGGADRPAWILQVTNDAWFGTLSGPWQHLAQARLRAVEYGLPFMRVANTGVTAAIDAKGRVLATLGLGVVGHMDVVLPAALPPTVYARLRDWPVVGGMILMLGLIFWRRRRG